MAHRGQPPHTRGDPGAAGRQTRDPGPENCAGDSDFWHAFYDLGLERGRVLRQCWRSGSSPGWQALRAHPLIAVLPPQANLPLLQRELLHCARLAKQNPAQYLAQHEQLLLDASTTSPVDSSELLLDVNENGKRRTPDR